MLNIQIHFGRKKLKININKSGIGSWTSKFSLRERKRERENLDVEHLDSLWEKNWNMIFEDPNAIRLIKIQISHILNLFPSNLKNLI